MHDRLSRVLWAILIVCGTAGTAVLGMVQKRPLLTIDESDQSDNHRGQYGDTEQP